jgi:xanthine dehydrogenase accessory factor
MEQGNNVMLLYVIDSKGSSPGRRGFMMVVNSEEQICGSIGGGIMEHKFVELAKTKLRQHHEESSVHQQLHDKVAAKNQSGMICSGQQTIFMYTLQQIDLTAVKAIIRSLEENKNGTLQLSPAGIQFIAGIPETDFYFSMTSEVEWLYREKIGYKNHLHVIGAGHCALALCRLMMEMEFYIHLYDDRSSLKTFEENESVHEKKILADYSELKDLVPDGDNQYVVVMTVGYRTDDIVVRTLWNRQFRYIGLLGSKSKIEKMFTDYRSEGVAAVLLDPFHAPVGISIHSQTPEEIAISIAAEIIQVKNNQ